MMWKPASEHDTKVKDQALMTSCIELLGLPQRETEFGAHRQSEGRALKLRCSPGCARQAWAHALSMLNMRMLKEIVALGTRPWCWLLLVLLDTVQGLTVTTVMVPFGELGVVAPGSVLLLMLLALAFVKIPARRIEHSAVCGGGQVRTALGWRFECRGKHHLS